MEMTIIQSGHDLTSDGLVSQETGELKDTVTFVVERGSYVVTPGQQEQRRKAQAERERRAIERGGKREEKFVFVDANIDFSGMRPATITRLVYLSTYAGYRGSRNRESPLIRNGTHLKKKDLADVLHISERHAASFLKEVSPTYVYADSKRHLYLDGQSFIRGGLRKKSFKTIPADISQRRTQTVRGSQREKSYAAWTCVYDDAVYQYRAQHTLLESGGNGHHKG